MKAHRDKAGPLRRVVLAIDGSPASSKAQEFVLAKFHPDRSTGKGRSAPIQVSVVHVMAPSRLAPFQIRMTVPWIRSETRAKDAASKLVERSVQELIKAGFVAKPVCLLGNPADEIMKLSAKLHADLIVMGAKGRDAIDRVLIGSVSTKVMQYANRPVLIVR